jgi:hypothetical protein
MTEPASDHHGDLRRALIEAALALLAGSQVLLDGVRVR